jgi:hypothetical protein
MNIESRRCICHPLQIPIEVQTLGVGEIHLLSGREMSPGVHDYFEPPWITIIEWPKRNLSILPSDSIRIEIRTTPNNMELRFLINM